MPIATPSRKWSYAYHESHILTWRFTKRQVGMPYECWLLQAAGNCWLQRICSSFASGKSTAEKLLRGDVLEDEDELPLLVEPLSALTPTEAGHLRTIIEELARPEA